MIMSCEVNITITRVELWQGSHLSASGCRCPPVPTRSTLVPRTTRSLSLPAAAQSRAAHNIITGVMTVSRVTSQFYLRVTSLLLISCDSEGVTSLVTSLYPLSATQSHYHALTVKLKTTILRLIVSTHNRSWPLGDTLCAHDIKLSGPEQWNRNDRNRFTGFQDAISNGNSALSGSNRDTTRNCHWSINSNWSLTTDYKVVMRMCHVVPVCGDNGTSGEWCMLCAGCRRLLAPWSGHWSHHLL